MPETAVARVEILPGKLWRVDIAGALAVEPGEIANLMLKEPGGKVVKDQVIAAGGDFFERRAVKSPASGVMALMSRNLGFAYVRENVEVGSAEVPVVVDVARTLHTKPRLVAAFTEATTKKGSLVLKGQVLASRNRGDYRDLMVKSPIYGRITDISTVNGTVTIAPELRSPDITAYLKGTVTRAIAGEGVEIEGSAIVITGIWGLGAESYGVIHAIDGDLAPEAPLPAGSVVAVSGTATLEGLNRARAAGVRGLVLGYLSSETAVAYARAARNMGITGDEDVPFPLVLTEGFLPAPMSETVFQAFSGSEGCACSIKGTTHIRAGVIRPEVLIYPQRPGRSDRGV
jgi:hypothetical protein